MYKYTRPVKGQVIRTRDGGTCYRLPALDLEPRKRTLMQWAGLVAIFPFVTFVIATGKTLDTLNKIFSVGLHHD